MASGSGRCDLVVWAQVTWEGAQVERQGQGYGEDLRSPTLLVWLLQQAWTQEPGAHLWAGCLLPAGGQWRFWSR